MARRRGKALALPVERAGMTIEQAAEAFLERDFSRNTLRNFRSDLGRFCEAFEDRSVGALESNEIQAYLAGLKGRGRKKASPATHNRHYATLHNLFGWLIRQFLAAGCYVGIATHDEKVVWQALQVIRELELSPDRYEFQMLLGVDEQLRRVLVDAGHRLRVYVPFGQAWYAYSTRRLKENPRIARYALRSFLTGD